MLKPENRSILTIDDDLTVLTILQGILTRAGYHFLQARTGLEGLEVARRQQPDLILLDVVLPDGDGRDFCHQLKADAQTRHIHVILLSALRTDPADQAFGLDAGADGYMAKPVHGRELLARVEAMLRIRQVEEALWASEARYRSLFNTISDPIMILDTEFRVQEANQAQCELLGLEPDAVVGKTCFGLMCHTTAPVEGCPHHSLMQDGQEHSAEIYNERLKRHYAIKVTPMLDSHNQMAGSVHVARDISHLKQTEAQLQKISNEYEKVFESTQDAMFLVEVVVPDTFRFIRNNRAHQEATGIQLVDLRDKTPQELLGKDLGDLVAANYQRCLETGAPTVYEETLNLPGGEKTWFTTLTPVFRDGQAAYIVGSAQDITPRKQAEERLQLLATTDELTGLWNRRHFMHLLRQELERARRYQQCFSLLMLDIDYFKHVNDTFGHAAGDAALQHLAASIRQHLRQVDQAGRLGGEEFAILLPQTTAAGAFTLAERLRQFIEQHPVTYNGTDMPFTVSIGLVGCDQHTFDTDNLLKQADDAMYAAKHAGRNRTCGVACE